MTPTDTLVQRAATYLSVLNDAARRREGAQLIDQLVARVRELERGFVRDLTDAGIGGIEVKPILLPADLRHKLPSGTVVSAVVPDRRCPLCNRAGHIRQGVGFDHERRCDDCNAKWEPNAIYLVVWDMESKLKTSKDSLAILEAWVNADPSRGFTVSYGNNYAMGLMLTLHESGMGFISFPLDNSGSLESQVRVAIAKFEEELK